MTGLGDSRSSIEDRLPDWVAGRLPEGEAARIAAAVEGDLELEREAELLRELRAAAPAPPDDLADRIVAAARAERSPGVRPGGPRTSGTERWNGGRPERRRWRPGGPLSVLAAAVLVLVIGTVLVERGGAPSAATDGVFDELPGPGLGEPSIVAGAPMLDDLSDEELTALLEELEG